MQYIHSCNNQHVLTSTYCLTRHVVLFVQMIKKKELRFQTAEIFAPEHFMKKTV